MVQVHPQETVDVPLAARRNAVYDCQLVLDEVRPPVNLAADQELDQLDDINLDGINLDDNNLDDNNLSDIRLDDVNDLPFGRLATAVGELIAVTAQLKFAHDGYGRPLLTGQAQASVVMPCQRCLEAVETLIVAELAQVIWIGDEPPSELTATAQDVMLSRTTEMSFAALLEDDLLLALPQKVCEKVDCEYLPTLAYPAPGYTSVGNRVADGAGDGPKDGPKGRPRDDLPDDRQRPFAGLGDLLKASRDDPSEDG